MFLVALNKGADESPPVSLISEGRQLEEMTQTRGLFPAEFLDNSSIHGLKQLSQSSDCVSKKIFWIFVLLGSFVGGCYEIYQVVSYYRLKPSATQISWTVQSEYEFPPMAFCPKRWLRVQRAEEMGLKGNELAYVISFLQSVDVAENFDEEKLLSELRALMTRNGVNSFADLIKSIAYDERGLLRIVSTPSNLTLAPALIENGLCYVIKVAPLKSGMLRTNVMLKLKYTSPSRVHEFDKKFQSKMLIRDWTGQRTNPISLTRNGIYEIAFDAEVHDRLSRPHKPCLQSDGSLPDKWLYTASGACENVCTKKELVRRHCLTCVDIEVIDILDLSMDQARPCSRAEEPPKSKLINHNFTSSDQKPGSPLCTPTELATVVEACKSECVPPCKQWIFKSTTNMLSDTFMDGAVVIWITYNPIDGILSFEEVPTYTWDTFLSNIGGQLGLWLGISAISVVQVVYYCGLACARAVKSRQANALL